MLCLTLLGVCLAGCASTDPLPLPEIKRANCNFVHQINKANQNKYAVVIKGALYTIQTQEFFFQNEEDLKKGKLIDDPYVDNDLDQITRLLISKGYEVFYYDMSIDSVSSVYNLLDHLAVISNDKTKLFIAYSGEGSNSGLMTRSIKVNDSNAMTMDTCMIRPDDLIEKANGVDGESAMLIGACQSGCIAEAARNNPRFRGIVFTSCPVGFATTPHEPSNLTALYATFLDKYSDPSKVYDLSELDITTAGYWWNNFRHKISDIGGDGLPISYDIMIYFNKSFDF